MPKILVENEWTYTNLTPSALTAYKGLHFVTGDILKQTTGSAVGQSVTVNENMDANQGTLWAWVWLDSAGNAGQLRYLFDAYVDANNRISVYISAANNLVIDVIGAGTTQTATTSVSTIKAQTWTHIAVTWSIANHVNATNHVYAYVNGAGAGTTSTPVVMTSLPATFSIGSDYLNRNCLSGYMAYKLTRYWMSSTDITNDYASGTGNTSFFTVSPHTVALGLTTESSTGIVYHTRGKAVSAIVDGATEDTVTTSTGSNTVFADNDRAIVSAGNGYSSNIIGNTFVDGTPSSTSVNVDDGAGADTGLIEKIGVYLTFNGSRKATAGNVCDITTGDFSINGWFKVDSIPGASATLVSKKATIADNTAGYVIFIDTSGFLRWKISKGDASDTNTTTLSTSLANGKWHNFSISFDRDGNGSIFVDGYSYATNTALTNVGANDITNASSFMLGACTTTASYLTGCISDVSICSDLQSSANALTLATTPMVAPADNVVSYWQLVDNTGTTAAKTSGTGGANFTLDSALMWTQSAFLSRSIYVDGDMRHGGIGAESRISGATVTKVTTGANVIADEASLSIVNTGAAQGYAGQSIKTAQYEDYYLYGLIKPQITPLATARIIDVDGTASMSQTVGQRSLMGKNIDTKSGAYSAVASGNTIHDFTTEDLSLSCWVYGTGTGNENIILKGTGSGTLNTYSLYFPNAQTIVRGYLETTGSFYVINTTQNVRDNKWHHLAATFDRDTAGNCKVYIDGIDATTSRTGTLANITTLTNTSIFYVAGGGSSRVCDVKLSTTVWTAAQVLYQYNNPFDISASAGTITEAYACTEGTGTTLTALVGGAGNNLTLSNALAWNLGEVQEVEHCFQAQDADTTIDLTVPCAVSGELAYWDNIEMLKNYISNGGME
jgi:hypothetical protein